MACLNIGVCGRVLDVISHARFLLDWCGVAVPRVAEYRYLPLTRVSVCANVLGLHCDNLFVLWWLWLCMLTVPSGERCWPGNCQQTWTHVSDDCLLQGSHCHCPLLTWEGSRRHTQEFERWVNNAVHFSCWTQQNRKQAKEKIWNQKYRMAKKIGTIVLYALTLRNIKGFSKLFHCQNQE